MFLPGRLIALFLFAATLGLSTPAPAQTETYGTCGYARPSDRAQVMDRRF